MKKIYIQILILFLVFSLGFFFRPLFFKSTNHEIKTLAVKKSNIKYWVAPMNPMFRSNKPGKSPMGMDLVPVYVTGKVKNDNSVKISSRIINNLGVVTYKSQFQKLSKIINTVGYITANQDNIENVHSYTDGWVRHLRVNAVGEMVKKGQVLFELFSPSLVNAQQELLLAIKSNNQLLISAGRKKLITLGLNDLQINNIVKSKTSQKTIPFLANTSGMVSKLNIRDGMYIKPTSMLMVIEDLSSIWLQVAVYEKESNWVQLGQSAISEFPGLPGRQWQGEVVFVYPALDKITHTLPVRLKFPNPNLTLKPNMYAFVQIFVPSHIKHLVIPTTAIIPTSQGAHVILALGEGRFKPQDVILGDSSGNMTSIISGLNNGDVVVTSGQFLIDSESNLNAAFESLAPQTSQIKAADLMMDITKKSKVEHLNKGIILAIDVSNKSLTLSHQPIRNLAMPTMVMEVKASANINLNSYKIGQAIQFKLKRLKNNKYEIIKINKKQMDKL